MIRRVTPLLAVLSAASLVPFLGAAEAGSGAGGATLTIEAGVDGGADPGEHVIVTVSVAADRAIDGTIEASFTPGPIVAQNVDLAGGATKLVRLVVQVPIFREAMLTVRMLEDGETVTSERLAIRNNGRTEYIGVTAGIAPRADDLPNQQTLPGERGVARFVGIDAAYLDVSAIGLNALDSIVTTSSELAALNATQRLNVLAWVNAGGRLLVDDDGALDVLPVPWQPGAKGYALAGRGEVRRVRGLASAGKWAEFLEPSAMPFNERPFGGGEMFGMPSQGLMSRGGLSLPSLTPLLVVLGAYALLIGPIAYLVLKRRGRLTLAWVVIPAAAAVLSAGVVIVGSSWGSSSRRAVNALVEGFPGGGQAYVQTLAVGGGSGTDRVTLPERWTIASNEQARFWFGTGELDELSPRLAPIRDGVELRVQLDTGQVTTLEATGLVADSTLDVTATVEDAESRAITGTVRNTGSLALRDVAVFVGGSAVGVGELAPGQSKPWELTAQRGLTLNANSANMVWRDGEAGFGNPLAAEASAVDFSMLTWAGTLGHTDPEPSGLARAVGWSTEPFSALSARGDRADRVMIAAVAPIGLSGGTLIEAANRFELTSGPWGMDGSSDMTVRLALPPDTEGPLVLDFGAGGAMGGFVPRIEAWSGAAWVELKLDDDVYPVPEGAAADGTVELRFPAEFGFAFGQTVPGLRSAS